MKKKSNREIAPKNSKKSIKMKSHLDKNNQRCFFIEK